ncbi:MAG: histone deacetylase [Spirochaetales bacterium]|nr:histone deacetylase [Spirochaetales bacterium]
MVLFNENNRIAFPRYGIQIPSLPTRAIKTVEALKAHPLLGPRSAEWLIEKIPNTIGKEDLLRAHTTEYISDLYSDKLEERLLAAYELIDEEGNFNRYDPDSAEAPLVDLLEDVTRIISGTYRNIQLALDSGFNYFLGGGMHHAHPAFGHGFCLVNDICTALLKARAEGLIHTAWIIDVDAHRGDGTAEILAQTGEITTISIHMAKGWPLDKPQKQADGSLNPGWFPGDVDLGIESGEEADYTPRLMEALNDLEAKQGLPDLFFIVAGVDPFEGDELASTDPINLSRDQMFERDRRLYQFCQEKNRPSAWVAAGGYGQYSWEIHARFLEWVLQERLG